MTGRFKTALLVVLITAVTWLYAEAETLTRAERDVSVTIAPRAETSVSRVTDADWTGVVRVSLEGAAGSIDKAPRFVELVPGVPGFPRQDGEHTIDIRAALASAPGLARAGVNILDARPATVRVRVQSLARLDGVEVRPEAPGVTLASPAASEPGAVAITGPRATIEKLSAQLGGAYVLARVTPASLATLAEGQPTPVDAPLSLPPGFDETDVVITPREASVTLTKGPGRTAMVAAPPVRIVLPPEQVGRWTVTIEDDERFVRGVSVSGPPAAVEPFRTKELSVIAVAFLSPEDLAKPIEVKTLAFFAERNGEVVPLPAGVAVTAPETTVRLRIVPVAPAAGPVPGAPPVEPATPETPPR